jgi:hypothetical protein
MYTMIDYSLLGMVVCSMLETLRYDMRLIMLNNASQAPSILLIALTFIMPLR